MTGYWTFHSNLCERSFPEQRVCVSDLWGDCGQCSAVEGVV